MIADLSSLKGQQQPQLFSPTQSSDFDPFDPSFLILMLNNDAGGNEPLRI